MRTVKSYIFSLADKSLALFWRAASCLPGPRGEVLMYHHVTDEYVNILPTCKCSVDAFKESLRRRSQAGVRFISVRQMVDGDFKSGKPFAVVTFDDVPENVYHNAYPFLLENGIPFTIFLASSKIGTPGYLSKEQIDEMISSGICTVGAHSVSHCGLRDSKDAFKEISVSKRNLEKMFGRTVDFFAYPYGRFSSVSLRNMNDVKDAGFKCAFGTIPSGISSVSLCSRFFIPRIVPF